MRKTLTLGSLFDGSGGFPLAGALHGIQPVWASEIEPYPLRVTAARLPSMKQYGDITAMRGAQVEPVDIITFGSPCQDMSVAGKREGLTGARSGLFYEAIRIITEMREATNGQYPRYIVWKNVPGALSSGKGADFRCVLDAICKVKDEAAVIPAPADGRWEKAGSIVGNGYSVAWRILDAQFWGVPQRRRRIYLVADFRGECAEEILFKRESLSGDSAQGGTAREGAAEDAAGSAGGSGGVVYPLNEQIVTRCNKLGRGTGLGVGDAGSPAYTLQEAHPHAICYSIDPLSSNSMKSPNPHSGFHETEVVKCLDTSDGNPSKNQGGTAVVYALQGNGIDRADTAGCNGKGWREGASYTLNTIDRPAVVYDARGNGEGTVSPTLTGDHQNRVTDYTAVVTFDRAAFNQGGNAQYSPEIRTDGLCSTVVSRGPSGVAYKRDDAVKANHKPPRRYIVRRLTPLECCRLQGFPDWWEDGVEGSDSARYKMWGNGIALPCAAFVLGGIALANSQTEAST